MSLLCEKHCTNAWHNISLLSRSRSFWLLFSFCYLSAINFINLLSGTKELKNKIAHKVHMPSVAVNIFGGDIVFSPTHWMCLYNPKNSINALKIVRSTEPQQIDKNTNGKMKMQYYYYYYWVEKHLYLSHDESGELKYCVTVCSRKLKRVETNLQFCIHLIPSNKSDLLLVKTFYSCTFIARAEFVSVFALLLLNIIPKKNTHTHFFDMYVMLLQKCSNSHVLHSVQT